LLNLDLKRVFTIPIASLPEILIIDTAPTPEGVVKAIIVSLLYVIFVLILQIYYAFYG